MRSRRRDVEIFNMSFLDVVSCGFGAVILLLVLSLALEPATLKRITEDLRGVIAETAGARAELVAETPRISRELAEKKKSLARAMRRLDRLNGELVEAWVRDQAARGEVAARLRAEGELEAVRQSLSAETRRLLDQPSYKRPSDDATIGGIPVDSEYIIFVIDTSGSMLQGAWPLVVKKVEQVLSVYPRVKGIQVLNDMGSYMFTVYAGKWIPDTPARRREVIRRVRNWKSFSNSSPVEGVVGAIRQYFRADRRISIYVFGDDFAGTDIDAVINEVGRINKKDAAGKPRVRIHAFGFPVLHGSARGRANMTRFAHLMRLLAERNAGSFVGLNTAKAR
jgi:hypothetical protein